jgi:hypothetical protein
MSLSGLKFVAEAAFTPVGTTLLFVAFVLSCLSRVFLRDGMLKKLYKVVSIALLSYLVVVIAMMGTEANIGQFSRGLFIPTLFSLFLGVPFSVGWLAGWPVAFSLQLAAAGPQNPPAQQG